MRLVTFQRLDGTWEAGEYRDGGYYTLGTSTVLDIIRKGGSVDRREQFRLRSEPLLRAPLIPGKILCVGRNYAEHAAELGNKMPDKPLIFAKFGTSVITSGEHIVWRAAITSQVDWEGELGVVIGKRVKDITPEEADDAIFGYVVANDVSARDLQDADKQWARAKGMDTFCPIGPYLVTKDEIEDAHNLTIETRVNDEVMQRGHTGDMFFKIPTIIAYLSQTFTLEPGDLILTGTPAGVGKGMTPPRFLQDGDVVSVTIEGLGSVRNTCRVID
jgi:2-keto-4-pentenoate hydratase/2-oxohepta-3-ene-1,7-dioic acid hydratase in catechol pathway